MLSGRRKSRDFTVRINKVYQQAVTTQPPSTGHRRWRLGSRMLKMQSVIFCFYQKIALQHLIPQRWLKYVHASSQETRWYNRYLTSWVSVSLFLCALLVCYWKGWWKVENFTQKKNRHSSNFKDVSALAWGFFGLCEIESMRKLWKGTKFANKVATWPKLASLKGQ